MAVKSGVVRVSGRGTNVDFTIDDSATFDQVTGRLSEYLVENRGLWSSGTISVNAGRWMLSKDQLARIKQIIETESGLTVGRFWCSPEDLNSGDLNSENLNSENFNSENLQGATPGNSNEVSESPAQPPAKQQPDHDPINPLPPGPKLKQPKAGGSRKALPSEALFIRATFRSGESVSHPGDVVVLADVNPGAEISAEGDIVVFGSLRGMAHAGSAGDTKAAIIALDLDSPRIQIGPYTGLAPTVKTDSKSKGTSPKIAYVRRSSIYVSTYSGRFARYSRGILYDG